MASVQIKLAGAGSFAKLDIHAADAIGDLVKRACAEFPHWGTADRLLLYLVAPGGDEEPTEDAVSAVLSSGGRLGVAWSLERAGISSGAWLVAHKIVDSGGGGSGSGGGGGASGDASVREALATIIQMLSQQQQAPDSSTILSEQEYEDQAVLKLPAILLLRCGLEVVRGVDLSRADLAGQQWDFRAPVLLSATAPHPNGEGGVFEIFPSKPCYVRPEAVAARNLTPTKSSGQESPPAAHYLAILEMTVTPQWTRGSGGSQGREGLLARLEKRLSISLDRAYSHGYLSEKNILELVAVVGVVAPAPYSQSVQRRMSGANAPPLLKKLMDASRFVYIRIPRASTEGSP